VREGTIFSTSKQGVACPSGAEGQAQRLTRAGSKKSQTKFR
jgi:hypothetical protein